MAKFATVTVTANSKSELRYFDRWCMFNEALVRRGKIKDKNGATLKHTLHVLCDADELDYVTAACDFLELSYYAEPIENED